MKLLTMQEIMLSIMEETRDVDPEITEGLILKEAVIPRSEIEKLQTKLHIGTLNQIFTELILSYNWGNFGFLSYQFGVNDEETLNWIVQRNLEYADYDILHQYDLMIIANGDPSTILLECATGKVYAIDSETAYEDRILIADNFEMLVRAMGTGQYAVWNGKESEFISMIQESVNAKGVEFWRGFVSYYE
ncbi:SMI1/KNR4 family protein [Prevotella pallens]